MMVVVSSDVMRA